jgi:Bifunctional DNA primase/polymerase, N-terminal
VKGVRLQRTPSHSNRVDYKSRGENSTYLGSFLWESLHNDMVMTEQQIEQILSLALDGFALFPTVPNLRVPYADSHGYKDASLDEDRIRELWTEHPDGVPAIACGLSDPRLIVLDVDDDEGVESLARLESLYAPRPITTKIKTPHGWHYYFLRPEEHKHAIKSSISKIAAHLDIRADDGYVVAYPGERDRIAECPDWLMALITQTDVPEESDAKQMSEQTDVGWLEPEAVKVGQRHDWLYMQTCDLYPRLGGEETRKELQRLNKRLVEPKPESEVDEIVNHVIAKHIPATISALPWMAWDLREVFTVPELSFMTNRQLGLWLKLRAFAWDSKSKQGLIPADHKLLAKMLREDYTDQFESDDLPTILYEYRLDSLNGKQVYVNTAIEDYVATQRAKRVLSAEGGRKAQYNAGKKFVKGKITTERRKDKKAA